MIIIAILNLDENRSILEINILKFIFMISWNNLIINREKINKRGKQNRINDQDK